MISPLVFALLSAPPSGTGPSPEPTSAPAAAEVHTAGLVVDVTPLLEQEEREYVVKVERSVRRNLTAALANDHNLAVASAKVQPSVPTLVVRLQWNDFELAVYDVAMLVRWPDGQEVDVESFTKGMPARSMLVEELTNRLPRAVEVLRSRPPATEEPVAPASDSTPPSDDHIAEEAAVETDPMSQPARPADEHQRSLGKLGFTGVGLGAVGLVAAGTGLGLVIRGEAITDEGAQRHRVSNTQPPGVALLVGGGAALATGVALLLVDRHRARKTVPLVSFHSRGFSLGVTTRF